jgi:pyrimidine-nucleoside phosphorylase
MTPAYIIDERSSSASSSISAFSALAVIRKRKRGERHTQEELRWFVSEYTRGRIPDYQVSAWLMAAYFNPLGEEEIASLTRCMVVSGITLDWGNPDHADEDDSTLRGNLSRDSTASTSRQQLRVVRVDKHSSGGVGDKTSLLLAPWLAAVGGSDDDLGGDGTTITATAEVEAVTDRPLPITIQVPMMAGRGLGHTGGTIDKLESIPGFCATLDVASFQRVVRKVGCAITSPTSDLCPADRALYALRDVSGTVESVGLQTASILSKKLAENPNALVLDVKYGNGAFQAEREEATELATCMVRTAQSNGLRAVAFLTRMDQPLGRSVGNWLEVVECVELMTVDPTTTTLPQRRSRLSVDLMVVTLVLALEMLRQATINNCKRDEPGEDNDALLDRLIRALESGAVRAKFDEMVSAQGGDVQCLAVPDPERYGPPAAALRASRRGKIAALHAQQVGLASVALGAGRLQASDAIDFGAGLVWHKKVGDAVEEGDLLADVYGQHPHGLDACLEQLQGSVEYCDSEDDDARIITPGSNLEKRVAPSSFAPLVTHKVTTNGVEKYDIPPRLIELAMSWCGVS